MIRSAGIGALLMREAIGRARDAGHAAIVLVGDEPYYRRFGFSQRKCSGSGCRDGGAGAVFSGLKWLTAPWTAPVA